MKTQSRRYQYSFNKFSVIKALKFTHTLTKQFHFWKLMLKNKQNKNKKKNPSSIKYKKLEIT